MEDERMTHKKTFVTTIRIHTLEDENAALKALALCTPCPDCRREIQRYRSLLEAENAALMTELSDKRLELQNATTDLGNLLTRAEKAETLNDEANVAMLKLREALTNSEASRISFMESYDASLKVRDALAARAEKAEARVVELEAEAEECVARTGSYTWHRVKKEAPRA
jgi:chromosome segregation ATPase